MALLAAQGGCRHVNISPVGVALGLTSQLREQGIVWVEGLGRFDEGVV